MTAATPSSDAEAKAGYVYILTNASFREDWVKIGKSARPVNVRSKELDNTAVPLPFSIYATIHTVKYHEVEKHVHKMIDRLTHLRIRRNREFFNVSPELALETFRDIAEIIDDAVITIYEDNKPVREERPSQGATPGAASAKKSSKADVKSDPVPMKPEKSEKSEKSGEPVNAPKVAAEHSTGRAASFRFSLVGIEQGETIVFEPAGIEVRVVDDKKIEYQGRTYTLSGFTREFMPEGKRNRSGAYQGPLYFSYRGEILQSLRLKTEAVHSGGLQDP